MGWKQDPEKDKHQAQELRSEMRDTAEPLQIFKEMLRREPYFKRLQLMLE